MLEVALNELADILRREVDPLEAVIAEELRGLGMIQRLGNIGMNLRKKIGTARIATVVGFGYRYDPPS